MHDRDGRAKALRRENMLVQPSSSRVWQVAGGASEFHYATRALHSITRSRTHYSTVKSITMPRYRRRVVEAMSDHIEEDDDATQNQDVDAVDADEDEDQQPRPPRRTVGRVGRERSFAARGAPRDTPVPERDEPDDAQAAGASFDE